MKVEEFAVVMSSTRDFASERTVRYEAASSFHTVLDGSSERLAARHELSEGRAADRAALLGIEALIARLLELVSGTAPATDVREVLASDARLPAGQHTARPRRTVEIRISSAYAETLREHEQTVFSSSGKIRTADGRSLDFCLELAMCRDFSSQRTRSAESTIVLRDPLVINFAGKAAELSGQRFAFDLDADGTSEAIRALGGSSAYLAIDRNGDGRINDGSELFGTRSGDGFADLAALDSDGNQWLDAADAAFAALRVWHNDGAGQERLSALAEHGVGALYLGASDTPFTVTDNDNRTLAQIRASGIYLREDGRVGSLQQIDLAV